MFSNTDIYPKRVSLMLNDIDSQQMVKPWNTVYEFTAQHDSTLSYRLAVAASSVARTDGQGPSR